MNDGTTTQHVDAGVGHTRRRGLRVFLGVLLVAIGGFVVVLLSSSPAQAVNLEASMNCWDPHADNVGLCGAGSPDASPRRARLRAPLGA